MAALRSAYRITGEIIVFARDYVTVVIFEDAFGVYDDQCSPINLIIALGNY